jgi:signal transduction histidine kinase/CheY-like chemotaxis protein
MDNALWVLFFMFSILAGVLVWLFLLTNESRVVAQQESYRQNKRLLAEIEAHNRTDRELQAAKEHAEAASLAKSRYLSGISHEFRTPLQSILGYAQMLRIDKEMDRGRRRAVDVIHRSSEHLADLIEGLLDVSRIESGRIELRSEVVDLPELLNQMEQIFRPLAAAKGIAFYIRIDRQVPTFVNADAKRLRQILTNLLSNAVKFTAAGEVCLAARFRSEVAEFEVSDTGIGIDAGDLETVFKPFERVAQTGHTSGTGLGLTIVKLLTEVMGGDVSIASKAGGGSTFTVSLYLPRATRAPAPQTSQPKIVGYAGRLRTVMVVDDDPVQRGMIGDLLGPLGFDVVEARSGMHCLKLIASQNVDLFLLDVSMPGMDGLRLAASLRARGVRATIFMVSANAHEPPEVPNEHTGYDAYLVKPLRLTTLLDRIGETLDLIWVREEGADTGIDDVKLDREVCAVLVSHAEIGYAQGVRTALDQYVSADRMPAAFAERLHAHLDAIQFDELINAVEGASS